ncbi:MULTISPECIES: hypothetical protein [Cohaesibacter]|uniref:hypothetical protein n=1 Tax=Cohaesibacter TaxID=655352 RepID=UPI000DE90FA1|nr:MULTISPECIES: hypothetical protein [Cohaesibacter]TLP45490.1 hypothetical protein FDK21_12070 [Cohaesibacter sp. CAU 1516]
MLYMRRIKRWLIITIAIVLFLLGLASVWTPFPIGAVLMTFATVLLITNSRKGRQIVRNIRRRFVFVDARMAWFEARSKIKMVRVLKTTRPLERRLGPN